jgi:hypothetical protein
MKKAYVTALLTVSCLLGLGISARAQGADEVVVTVPFEFVAGGATLRAGEYGISRINPGVNREIAIHGYNNGSAFLFPMVFDGVSSGQPALTFEHVGGKYFLSKITTLGGVYTIAPPQEKILLGKMNAPGSLSSSGTH